MASPEPPLGKWGSSVERQIREAQERGEFDDLPGAGKPLPDIDRPYDELWWVRRKMRSEGLSYLPPSLQLRKDREQALARIARARSEAAVRKIVRETNEHIRLVNRTGLEGPPSHVAPLDEEQTVRRWRERRADRAG